MTEREALERAIAPQKIEKHSTFKILSEYKDLHENPILMRNYLADLAYELMLLGTKSEEICKIRSKVISILYMLRNDIYSNVDKVLEDWQEDMQVVVLTLDSYAMSLAKTGDCLLRHLRVYRTVRLLGSLRYEISCMFEEDEEDND